jgi:Nitrile hydratase beta subunit
MCSISTRSSAPRRKRRGVEGLGGEIDGKLTYYERWIVAFANILFQKQLLTPEELARKMDEVEARWAGDLASSTPSSGS